jgi:hypothetical protein
MMRTSLVRSAVLGWTITFFLLCMPNVYSLADVFEVLADCERGWHK